MSGKFIILLCLFNDNMRFIAFDSKKILRKEPGFKALLGVGITIHDPIKFANEYNIVMDELFKENGFSRDKIIYKSSDLLSIFYGIGIDVIPIIVDKLYSHLDFIDIYYSYFLADTSTKPYTMGIYWEEELKRVSVGEFLDLSDGPYPSICCHAYLKSLTNQIESLYLIDHCSGLRPSIASKSVICNKFTRFLFRGDQVSYSISIADILCKYIDQMCLNNGYPLNKDLIFNLGFDENKSKTTFIGPNWLRDIKPSRDIVLDVTHKYPHPIFFFFTDNDGPFDKNSKEVLEKSRLFSLVLDKAAQLGGSIKFFEPLDQMFITKEDFLIIHNELSEKKANELIKLSCRATIINSSKL